MLLDRGVINSGPLVALSLAGRLDLLPALFAEFWIPEQVFHEVVLAGVSRPGASALADARWALGGPCLSRANARPAADCRT